MPLITSPIDGSPMRQVHRYGIEIDVCPTSGGIWLDKGELEKLMVLLKEEAAGAQIYAPRQDEQRTRHAESRRYRDDDDDDDDYYRKERQYKKGKMSRMMDIFDF